MPQSRSNSILTITPLGQTLHLLPGKALYVESQQTLLVADVHLGKSETFQASGLPISSQVNHQTLAHLCQLCTQWQPHQVIILGDLFHSTKALTESVQQGWRSFLASMSAVVTVVAGNHDRPLMAMLNTAEINTADDTMPWTWHSGAISMDGLVLSHEPLPQIDRLNICGHSHPCLRLKTGLDSLRLPCFYWDPDQNILMLPAFGEFTGGHEVSLHARAVAYVIAEGAIIPIHGRANRANRRAYRR